MLRDAGLVLDDIDGILRATTVEEWKAIAKRRLEVLDEEIARLGHSREIPAAALLCTNQIVDEGCPGRARSTSGSFCRAGEPGLFRVVR